LAALRELRSLRLHIAGTDEELRVVSTLRGLEALRLETDGITEKGLSHLSGFDNLWSLYVWGHRAPKGAPFRPNWKLPRLESLELHLVPVGDAWAAQMRASPKLQRLRLYHPDRLTDAGVADLCALRGLQELELAGAKDLTDRSAELIATLPELRELELSCDGITDAGAAAIAKLRHLRKLELSCPKVSDAGIRHLAALKELEELDIGNTAATDACLADLATLPRLKELWAIGTKITRAGIERFERQRPGCVVILKTGTLSIAGSAGPAHPDDDEPAIKAGRVAGTLTAKGRAWIEVKGDGAPGARRYVPHWVGGAPKRGGRWDRDAVEAIEKLKVGGRVRVEWAYDLRPRVVKVEMIK
jgi:hypothetical protein